MHWNLKVVLDLVKTRQDWSKILTMVNVVKKLIMVRIKHGEKFVLTRFDWDHTWSIVFNAIINAPDLKIIKFYKEKTVQKQTLLKNIERQRIYTRVTGGWPLNLYDNLIKKMTPILNDKTKFLLISFKRNWNWNIIKICLKLLPHDNATNVIPNYLSFFPKTILTIVWPCDLCTENIR